MAQIPVFGLWCPTGLVFCHTLTCTKDDTQLGFRLPCTHGLLVLGVVLHEHTRHLDAASHMHTVRTCHYQINVTV